MKYGVDKETGAMFVDRFLNTAFALPVQLSAKTATLIDVRVRRCRSSLALSVPARVLCMSDGGG